MFKRPNNKNMGFSDLPVFKNIHLKNKFFSISDDKQ